MAAERFRKERRETHACDPEEFISSLTLQLFPLRCLAKGLMQR
jgi:hypothetical protein